MDHISPPLQPVHLPLEVPCCIESLDYTPPFETYPTRTGRSLEAIVDRDLWSKHNITDSIVDQLLQSWLFFGLLKEVFEHYCPLEDFIAPSEDGKTQRHVTTRILNDVCDRNAEYFQQLTEEQFSVIWKKQARAVIISREFISNLKCATPQSVVALSVLTLNVHLAAYLQIDQGTNNWPKYYGEGVLEKRMLADGWCPSQVWRHAIRLKPASLYILSNIRRPDGGITHTLVQEGGSCSYKRCGKVNIDGTTYKTAHATGRCVQNCHDTRLWPRANNSELETLLRRDDATFPVATYIESQSSKSLLLHSCSEVPRYVAISHVWAHGLGNAKNNALPVCQLRRLQHYTNSLYEADDIDRPVAFWVDTISCPTCSNVAQERAIHKMRATYSNADKVLVVDPHIESVAIASISTVEALLRIQSSLWTGRLWTFQEGALARDLYFQFKDRAVSFTDLVFGMKGRLELEFNDIMDVVSEWRVSDGLVQIDSQAHLVFMLSRALRHRATSCPNDEAICLATMAGFDTGAVWRHRPEENRMQKFWSMFGKIPTLIAFWTGDRLTEPGYGWAPATFLNQGPMTMPTTRRTDDVARIFSEEADRSADGITFSRNGFLLGQWKASIQADFWIIDKQYGWFLVKFDALQDSGSGRATRRYVSDKAVQDNSCLAIILQNAFDTTSIGEELVASGLLVQTMGPASIIRSEIICPVVVTQPNATWNDDHFEKVKRQADRIANVISARGTISQAHINEKLDVDDSSIHDEDIFYSWDRWNYCQRGQHRIFESVVTSGNQSWCVG